ncbi:MAG: hypothetical protein ACTHK8_21500 [Ginsengibacter sp.]
MFKRSVKKYFVDPIETVINRSVSSNLNAFGDKYTSGLDNLITINQKLLFFQLQKADCKLSDISLSIFSESDEDGLLLYIFSKIGFKNKVCVDIGGGAGLTGSNSANLFLNHGFSGLIFEGHKDNADALRSGYKSNKATRHFPPEIICEYVTPENIDRLIASKGIKGAIDLLSIDIDSVDYWIWDAIRVIEPNIVIVEVQCILDPNESKTVPRDFKETLFETVDNKRYGIYNSASLLAFTKLASKKGYSLVATSQLGFNAIFIRNELVSNCLPEISVEQALDKPFVKWAQKAFGDKVKRFEWTEV